MSVVCVDWSTSMEHVPDPFVQFMPDGFWLVTVPMPAMVTLRAYEGV